MAKGGEKNNAKPNIGLPTKIPVNAGTAGSVPTPPNLGVPTPPLPFDPATAAPAMQADPSAVTPPGPPQAPQNTAFNPEAAMSALGPNAGMPDPFPPSDDVVNTVRGMIHNWTKDELKNLITFAAHLMTLDAKKNKAKK